MYGDVKTRSYRKILLMCLLSTIIGTLFCLFIRRQPIDESIAEEERSNTRERFCDDYLKYECLEKISKLFKNQQREEMFEKELQKQSEQMDLELTIK